MRYKLLFWKVNRNEEKMSRMMPIFSLSHETRNYFTRSSGSHLKNSKPKSLTYSTYVDTFPIENKI